MKTAPKRPTRESKEVVDLAVAMCLKKLTETFTRPGEYVLSPADADALMRHLAMSLDHRDGFRIGKDLENRGWYVSGGVVAVLHEPWIDRALDAAVRSWVQANGITAQHLTEDVVTVVVAGEPVDGTIIMVDPAHGRYVVRVEAHGHDPRTGYTVPFEDAVARDRKD